MIGRRSNGSSREAGGDQRGQSEVIGVVLILGIATLGIAGVVLFGDAALGGLQSQSELGATEQAMAVFDSRAAVVALGESDVQTVPMGQTTEGGYSVHPATDWPSDPASGSITVTHLNYDGSGNDEVLYEGGLGSVVYERDGTEVAYQGGGVWKKSRDGEARMISPPELYYQGSTLTLPIIRTQKGSGTGGGGGATSATITEGARATEIFPATTESNPRAPYNGTNDPYQNSIENGEVVITIRSEYAAGWAEYFEQRTGGSTVTLSPDKKTVNLILTSVDVPNAFTMPSEGDFISIGGFPSDHSSPRLSRFDITLRPDARDSADFSNLQWSFFVERGNQQFEIHLRKSSGSGCNIVVSATIYYSDDYGNTYQGWQDDNAFTTRCRNYDTSDPDDEVELVANLAGSKTMTYTSLTSSDLVKYNPSRSTLTNPITFDQHGTIDDGTYKKDEDSLAMKTLIDHYFVLLGPSFSLTVDDQKSDSVSETDEPASSGDIRYIPSDQSITFLHVTENEIEVKFE